MTPGLATIGHIAIPPAVLKHRFVIEALCCARLFEKKNDVHLQVVGTQNTRGCELYGWKTNVDSHADGTGWIYLLPLDRSESKICAYSRMEVSESETLTIAAHQGDVIRMFDYLTHWTTGEHRPRVAAFVGSWPEPADDEALALLSDGIGKLAAGAYYGAPRVGPGFRAMQPDECYVHDFDTGDFDCMLLDDARNQGKAVIECAECDTAAVAIDHHFPWCLEMNRCRAHLSESEKT